MGTYSDPTLGSTAAARQWIRDHLGYNITPDDLVWATIDDVRTGTILLDGNDHYQERD